MEETISKLNKTIDALVAVVDANIVLLSKAATTEEKNKIAETIQFLTASQKNIADVIYNFDNSSFDDLGEDFEDDLDDDDLDDFIDNKRIDFKTKKGKVSSKGKKKPKDDDDLPF